MVAHVGEDGARTLGFCISEAKEEICDVGFAKWLRKTNKSEGRLGLDGVTVVAFDSDEAAMERLCGGGEGSGSLSLNGGDVW